MKLRGLLRVALVCGCVPACQKRAPTAPDMPPLFEELSHFEFPSIEGLSSAGFDQNLTVAEAMARAGYLRKGMTRRDVLLLLGRPAMMGQDHWLYLPQEDGATVLPTAAPNRSLEVNFEKDRLVSWSKGTVMFGVGGGGSGSSD